MLAKKMVTKEVALILKDTFIEVMKNNDGELVEMRTDLKDTVLLFLKLNRKHAPATIISTLKSASSRRIKNLVEGVERGNGVYGTAYWGSGYDIFSDFSIKGIYGEDLGPPFKTI
ncbi:MAG: hypothetical protein HOP07_03875 [Bacteriovoracaceae bacterium]|nr:hypothetical protein [Bacteriovoracaceae bacterium]